MRQGWRDLRARISGMSCLLLVWALVASTWANERFTHLATHRGSGAVLAALVGPGSAPQRERFYQSYIYSGGTLELVAIDPDTGAHTVFRSPVASEVGAWAMTVGPDGQVYLGTLPHAHLLRFDPRTGRMTDLGRPSATESYIWQLTRGPDQRLYGCTYPSAKLIRFDSATGTSEDLGRMHAAEQYARSVAASDDGFVYIGVGSRTARLVAYEIATGEHREMPSSAPQSPGFAHVQRGDDGQVYGAIGTQSFHLTAWQALPVPATAVRMEPPNRLRDGRLIMQAGEGVLRIHDPRTQHTAVYPFRYRGNALPVFRLGLGPDDLLYASGALPLYFSRIHPQTGGLHVLGMLGGGEVYAFLRDSRYLLGAAYSGHAPLFVYDPAHPFAPGQTPSANPRLIDYPGAEAGWRPTAMIMGPDQKVYLGAVAGYGQLGGPLTVWDPMTHQVTSFPHVVEEQSVVSLTVADGLIVGGSTIHGGGGSRSTQTDARLFLWDVERRHKLFETVPVPGASSITNLITAPNRIVYGVAGKHTLFVFDPRTRQVLHTASMPVPEVIYNSVALGPDGQIWGLATSGIFAIDPVTLAVQLVDHAPEPVTAGFAFDAEALYYASGAKIYRYQLPLTVGLPSSSRFQDSGSGY